MIWAGAALLAPALAITIDDLPAHGAVPPGQDQATVMRGLVDGLGDAPAFGFVNGAKAAAPDARKALSIWRASGRPVGNHGWSHLDLDRVGTAAFLADVARNEPLLRAAMPGGGWQWLRFPYLHAGRDPFSRSVVTRWLAGRGYRIAPATMNFDDWQWTEAYARCSARGDGRAIGRMERSFLQAAATDARRARTVGGDQVLLLHGGAFTARMMPRLLGLYRRSGFRIAPLADVRPQPVPLPPGNTPLQKRLEALCR